MKLVNCKLNSKTERFSLMVKTIRTGLMVLCISFCTAFVSAEELSVSVASQSNSSIQTPTNGQKMENVQAQYGEPIERVSPVGEPPISKWVYSEFTVYFEHDLVLHSVMHKG